jgi:hypothetical protein
VGKARRSVEAEVPAGHGGHVVFNDARVIPAARWRKRERSGWSQV